MQVRYTFHARRRMAQRGVRADEVLEALESPDELEQGDSGEMIAISRRDFHQIRVVYAEAEPDLMVVFTVIKVRLRF